MVKKNETKTDRRVLYTKMFLKESLLELMKEKPVDKINPTELCRHAGINRNTFYTHYYSPRDVLLEIEEEFSNEIIASLDKKLSETNSDALLDELCRIIYDKKDFCKILLSENGDPAFLQNVISMGKAPVVSSWKKSGIGMTEEDMEMLFTFIVNGSIAILRRWTAEDMMMPPAEIAQMINRISSGGISGMIRGSEK
ncbi:MAG: TetR/AcrR family transcriptional regulator [Oscillospiraceae bacterium]|nr:TetR/AcrR family transcriptional regulator [Oscillospiraceae bacterium]